MRITIESGTVLREFTRRYPTLSLVLIYFVALGGVVLGGALLLGAVNLVLYFAPDRLI